MSQRQLGYLLQQIDRWTGPAGEEPTDGQLVERFVAMREETAFESLVRRHGSLVLRVCRRVLNDCHAADDAFQATFLILVRKAGSIRRHQSVGSWLYGVAYRVANKARASAARRQGRETDLPDVPADSTEGSSEIISRDLRAVLDEEMHRLAEKHRAPLVLCYLQGKTYTQAARELGYSEGSMSRRLAQAREELRQRLARRGIALSTAGLAAALASEAKAAVPAALIDAVLRLAASPIAGYATTSVAALAEGVLMLPLKIKFAAGMLAVLATVGIGAGLAVHWGPTLTPTVSVALNSTPIVFTPIPDVPESPEESGNMDPPESMPEMPETLPDISDPIPPVDVKELDRLFELPPAPKLKIQRRDRLSEEEHRARLAKIPEMNLEDGPGQKTSKLIADRANAPAWEQEQHFTPNLLVSRSDLAGLPMRKRGYCQLEDEAAQSLAQRSRELRRVVAEAREGAEDPRVLAGTLRVNFYYSRGEFKSCFGDVSAVPTMVQMLMAEPSPVRRVLAEQLGRIASPTTSAALAKMALFDLSPEVRADAVESLAARPAEEYRSLLLEGFRYPWSPAADHAAEALVALQDRGAVPELQRLAELPDPAAPTFDPEQKTYVVRELVRINHLRNCLLCHAPTSKEREGRLLGLVPVPGQPLPPPSQYYQSFPEGATIVRADVTYLRQDFSTMHFVSQPEGAQPDPWPAQQRYDYLVRNRPVAPPADKPGRESYPQRDAVLYALKVLQAR